MTNTLDKSTETLIEEAVDRFKKWSFYEQEQPFTLAKEQVKIIEQFLRKELSTIASKSAEAERENTLEVIKSIRRITNSLYKIQQGLENETSK